MSADSVLFLMPHGPETQVRFVNAECVLSFRQLDVSLPELLVTPIGDIRPQKITTITQRMPIEDGLNARPFDGGGEDGFLPILYIDDQEFTWEGFGRMLCTHSGWGMRVVVVPDDELEAIPRIVVREPDN